jgi:cell division protein FtsB
MIEFQKKNRVRRIVYSPVVLIFLLILLLLLLRGVLNVHNRAVLSKNNLKREQIELNKIVERERSLESSLEYLKTDQGIENEIRSKFRAVKEGEKLAVILDDNPATTTSTTTEQNTSLWNRIINWFVL